MSVLIGCCYCVFCCLFKTAEFHCNCIREAAVQEICFSDCLCCCDFDCFSCRNLRRIYTECYAISLCDLQFLIFIVDIGDCDRPCDCFSECIFVSFFFCVALCDDKCRINRFFFGAVGYRQSSECCCDHIVHCLGVLVQCVCECVFAVSDKCL